MHATIRWARTPRHGERTVLLVLTGPVAIAEASAMRRASAGRNDSNASHEVRTPIAGMPPETVSPASTFGQPRSAVMFVAAELLGGVKPFCHC